MAHFGPTSLSLARLLDFDDDTRCLVASSISSVQDPSNTPAVETTSRQVRNAAEKNPEGQVESSRPSMNAYSGYQGNSPELLVAREDDKIFFTYPSSSDIRALGLTGLQWKIDYEALPLRRALHAAEHFFKYLRLELGENSGLIRSLVDARVFEASEDYDRVVLIKKKLVHPLKRDSEDYVDVDPDTGVLNLKASADPSKRTAPAYVIELVNKFIDADLFAWAYFFDCSTMQILTLYDPCEANKGTAANPTLPRQSGPEPQPVTLNFWGEDQWPPLYLALYEDQELDVGFIKIFLSTRLDDASFSTIAQDSPFSVKWRVDGEIYDSKNVRGDVSDKSKQRDEMEEEASIPDLWDTITIPVVQRIAAA